MPDILNGQAISTQTLTSVPVIVEQVPSTIKVFLVTKDALVSLCVLNLWWVLSSMIASACFSAYTTYSSMATGSQITDPNHLVFLADAAVYGWAVIVSGGSGLFGLGCFVYQLAQITRRLHTSKP